MIPQELFRVVLRFPRYISSYIAENRLPFRLRMQRVDS